MADNAKRRSRKSKIQTREYGEAIEEEIIHLQKISSSIDATPAESVISESKEATDNKNIKNKITVKRKKTLHSEKSSNPTHIENVVTSQVDIIEPQLKISKIVGNYSTDNEITIDKSVPMPMPLQFSIKVEVEEFEEDFCIENVTFSPKNSKIGKDIVKSELKSYENTSASKNIKESSGVIDESVGSAGITEKSNSTDEVIPTNNKLIIPSKPIVIKLPTMHPVNKIPLEPEVIKLFDPVKTRAQSLVKLIEMTTYDTEQLLKSIDNLDKDTDNSSKTGSKTLESISTFPAVANEHTEAILVENEKRVARKGLLDDPAEPLLDKNERHATYRDTYVFEIDYVLETAEELFRSSTDPVDKKLEGDFRSHWCRPQVIFEGSPTENMLQDSIKKWRYWQNTCQPRETPVYYKCYICMKAWWHLSEFRDHIRTHNEHNLNIDLEKNSFECSIISYLSYLPEQEDIFIEGKCWKCRYGFEEHTLRKRYFDNLYKCYKCNEKFYTCTAKRNHEERCEKDHRLLMGKVKTFSYKCEQCAATFDNKEALYDHQIHHHCVRSDVPAWTYGQTCKACKACILSTSPTYHSCPKKFDTIMCKYCGKSFSKFFLAAVHMNLTKSNVKCNFCERVLTKECLMMEHLVMEHSVNFMLVYRCRICPTPVLMRTPLAITRHRKKCHSNVKCNVTMMVPIPKKCLGSEFDASRDSSLDEYKQDGDIEIITDTHKEQDVIEIIDSDEEDERDETINIKTEIFEAEENELQIDEDNTNSIDNEENAMISIKYDNVDNEQSKNANNFNIANKLIYNNDVNVKQEIVDDEYEKELHINLNQAPEECDQGPDSENEYEKLLSKVFQASKFVNASSILDVGVTDKQKAMVTEIKRKDLISIFKAEPVDEDYQDDLIILKADHNINESNELITDIKQENNPEIKIEEFNLETDLVIESGHKYKCKCKFTGTKKEIDEHNKKMKCVRKKRRRLYRCNKCDFVGSHKQFKSHAASAHCDLGSEIDTINCTKCGTNFDDLQMYADHFEDHGVPEITCPVCLESFDASAKLERHIQAHIKSLYVRFQVINMDPSTAASHKDGNKRFQCKKCQALVVRKQFFEHWESHLKIIIEKEHTGVVKQENNNSAETASVDRSYASLNDAYTSLDAAMLQIVLCNLQSTVHSSLTPAAPNSERKGGPSEAMKNTCCVCLKKFHRYSDSKRHLIEHLVEDAYVEKITNGKTNLRCQICNSEHAKIDTYKLHMREHASLPIYRCELCNKSFSDSSNFTKHKKVHNLKVVICNICDKKFQMKASLEKHMIMVHLTGEPIKCTRCTAIFYENSAYRRHVRGKHDRVPYKTKCYVCGIRFERLKDQWDHMWEQHKQRKIAADCPLCDMSYRKYSDVKKHMADVHRVTSLPKNAMMQMNMAKHDSVKYKVLLRRFNIASPV